MCVAMRVRAAFEMQSKFVSLRAGEQVRPIKCQIQAIVRRGTET